MVRLSELLKLDLSKNVLEHASVYILSKLKDYQLTIDENKNIYVTKGSATYPSFAASIDASKHEENFLVDRIIKNVWVGFNINNRGDIVPANIGMQSKVAIYLAFKLLEQLENVKIVFKFTDVVNKTFFDDCRWVLELTGKGNKEIVTSHWSDMQCSDTFKTMLNAIGKTYGYEVITFGTGNISRMDLPISVGNIPVGHYEPYTGFAQVVEADVTKAHKFCLDFANKIGAMCKIDSSQICQDCKRKLSQSEEHYCYPCLTILRTEKHITCKKCNGKLYTSQEFFKETCRKC